MSRHTIRLTGDRYIHCPAEGCKVGMTLTKQGIEMMLARETKCREHGLHLVVEEPETE